MADPSPATDATTFLTIMAAMSTAVQTFIDHIIKGRWKWLDTPTPNDPINEGRRQSIVHLVSFLVGFAVAFSLQIRPLTYLGLEFGGNVWTNAVATGLMVSFGSSFFNEALDAVRAFKKAQEGVRQAQLAHGTATTNTIT